MPFYFNTLAQEIGVWHLLTDPYESNPNVAFYRAVSTGDLVELDKGEVDLVKKSDTDPYEETSWMVFDYNGKTYRMDVDEYDSWDEDGTISEPYEVIPVPVNEVQYLRKK